MNKTISNQPASLRLTTSTVADACDWRSELPTLCGERVELRPIEPRDAVALFTLLSAKEVTRFIATPPTSIAAFERFIERTRALQRAGAALCYVMTLRGHDTAIGMIQMRETEPHFAVAEWGFALGSAFWGTGLFEEAAELVLAFAFDTLCVHRLEARAVIRNGRGTRALLRLGAVQEGILRRSFFKDGEYLDQGLFAIVDDDWRASRRSSTEMVH